MSVRTVSSHFLTTGLTDQAFAQPASGCWAISWQDSGCVLQSTRTALRFPVMKNTQVLFRIAEDSSTRKTLLLLAFHHMVSLWKRSVSDLRMLCFCTRKETETLKFYTMIESSKSLYQNTRLPTGFPDYSPSVIRALYVKQNENISYLPIYSVTTDNHSLLHDVHMSSTCPTSVTMTAAGPTV